MKKILSLIAVVTLVGTAAYAQEDKQVFNHLAAGVTLGIDGVGLELATTLTPYVQVRGGYSIFPYTYKRTETLSLDLGDGPKSVDVPLGATLWKGGNGKLLFDLFPGKNTGFHFTLGAYMGSCRFISAYGDTSSYLDPSDYANTEVEYNGVAVTTDPNGFIIVDAQAKLGSIMPYAGIGFGRAITPSNRVKVTFDLGVLYTGGLNFQTYNYANPQKEAKPVVITSANLNNEDKGWVDKLSAFPVLPMLKFNIFFRIF